MNSHDLLLNHLSDLITKKKRPFRDKDTGEVVERYSSRDNRSLKLLKMSKRSSVDKDNWFIYVPPCFNDCLDISETDRIVKTGRKIIDKKTGKEKEETKVEKKWTQGSRFSFHRGCTLYDTPKAYQKWDEAIREIKYCISVENAMDARPAMNFDDRFPGLVDFSVFKPSTQKEKLEKIGDFSLTQDDFVRFLIEGNSEIIPITNLFLF
jgi:hypothetical protein